MNPLFLIRPHNRKLCYEESGDPKGFPLFFFHGWPGSRLQGRNFDSIGKKIGIRIVATDRPGFGQSDYYAARTLLDWADDIAALADHLKIKKFSILGNTGGGPYAAACAFKISQRIHKVGISVGLSPTNVKGVLAGMALPNQIIWFAYHYFPFLMKLNSLGCALRQKLFPHKVALSAPADQKMLSDDVKNSIVQNQKEAFGQGIKGAAQDLKLYSDDWGFELEDIRAKVYLWYGEQDKNVSVEMGKLYAKRIPGAHLKVYKDVGHLLLMKYGEDVLKELVS